MIHLGDITKIDGTKAPVVDVVVGGSPCQDLSVAGKRAGLDGERSGLFMEQIRIVKEMRKQDELRGRTGVAIRPRYMLWENVPGAFSSNSAEDFRIVLEETAKVADENAVIPVPPKGKWTNAGCIMGDGWSIAWRGCDAQFWGVPQRRRRIALVADFGGQSAPEILFVRKGVSGHSDESEPKRKETACDATRGFGANDRLGADQYNAVILGDTVALEGNGQRPSHRGDGYIVSDKSYTLNTTEIHGIAYGISAYDSNAMKSSNPQSGIYEADTERTLDGNCGMSHGRQCVLESVTAAGFKELNSAKARSDAFALEKSPTLSANKHDACVCIATAYGISSYDSNAMKSSNPHSGIYEADTARTLDGNGGNPSCNQGGIAIVEPIYTVDQGGEKSACNVQEGQAPTLTCTHGGEPAVCYSVENHPADSRVDIDESGKVQILTSRMGTGGGNVPMVMQCYSKSKRAQSATDNETWVESDTANTINAFDVGDTRTTETVVYALDRASFNQGKNAQYDFEITDSGVNSTVVAKGLGAVCYAIGNGQVAGTGLHQKVESLNCMHDPQAVMVAVDCRNGTEDTVNGSLQSNMAHSLNGSNVVRTRYIVRRLTPLECERLQGFEDFWTKLDPIEDMSQKDYEFWKAVHFQSNVRKTRIRVNENGEWEIWKRVNAESDEAESDEENEECEIEEVWENTHKLYKHKTKAQMVKWYNKLIDSESARYKALGNSISLPNWKWVLKRLSACYERDATMASLFDGIGGFPYLWEQLNGKGSCLWASEIEEFPMAVTKVRLG